MRHYIPEECFELEATSKVRHEYLEGELSAMLGASKSHNLIAQNLAASLRTALRGKGCQTFVADGRLLMKENIHYVYPHVLVTCDPADRQDAYLVRHPVLMAEILSPSTAEYDRTEKFATYQKMPSLRQYLLVLQMAWVVEWFRRDEAGQWVYTLLHEPTGVLEIPDLEIVLPLRELYEDTDVAPLRTMPLAGPADAA